MPDPEVLAIAGFVVTVILLLILAASIRVVHEGEFMVVFRLGRARGVVGAGLAVIIPLIDRGVRVAVPVGMVDLGVAGGRSRAQRASPSQEIQGYPGLEIAEVYLRAAILARQGSPKTRRATAGIRGGLARTRTEAGAKRFVGLQERFQERRPDWRFHRPSFPIIEDHRPSRGNSAGIVSPTVSNGEIEP